MARAILAQNTQDARKGKFCFKPLKSATLIARHQHRVALALTQARRTQENYG